MADMLENKIADIEGIMKKVDECRENGHPGEAIMKVDYDKKMVLASCGSCGTWYVREMSVEYINKNYIN